MFRPNQTSAAANEKLQALSRETLLLRYHRKQLNHQKDLMESLLRSAAAKEEDLYGDIGSRVSDMKNLGLFIDRIVIYMKISITPLYYRLRSGFAFIRIGQSACKSEVAGVEDDFR